MLHQHGARNALLKMATNFLDGDDGSIEKVISQAQETPPSQLVSTFSYLSDWISSKINDTKDPKTRKKVREAFKIIGAISLRLPPVFLLNSEFDFDCGASQNHWRLTTFFRPINQRLVQLRSYVQPFSFYIHTNPSKIAMFGKFLSRCSEDLDLDPSSQTAYIKYFKRLIFSHAPIEKFRVLLGQRNAREILTKAFIEVLEDLNNCKTATYEQLGFGFSYVFLYINAFTVSSEIDSQMLCTYLQTRPFLSPFCLLAIVNHIPQNIYLFNLLTPKELAQSSEQAMEPGTSQYNMQDFSLPQKGKITNFIKQIPTIVRNYFLCTPNQNVAEITNSSDDNDFLTFIHLSSNPMYIKMKDTLRVARGKQIGPFSVSCMGILLLRCIIFSLQRTILECADTEMFTSDFCYFMKAVISLLGPAFSSGICMKFLDPNEKNENITSFVIKGVYYHTLHLVVQNEFSDNFSAFLFHALKVKNAEATARLIFGKILQCQPLKLSEKLIGFLNKCDDALILLEFLDVLTFHNEATTCEEYNKYEEVRNNIMKRLQITAQKTNDSMLIIDSFKKVKKSNFNETSARLIKLVSQISLQNAFFDIQRILEKKDELRYNVLRLISLTSFMKVPEVAELVVDEICVMIRTYGNQYDTMRFEIRDCEYGLVLGEAVLGRLLTFNFQELTLKLLKTMMIMLPHDSLPLHWASRFINSFRRRILSSHIEIIKGLISNLPGSDENFISSDENMIENITTILESRIEMVVQDPDVINYEYSSPFELASHFGRCSILLQYKTSREIATILTQPIYDFSRVWKKRELAITLCANIASRMDKETAQHYFTIIMEHEPTNYAIAAGREFLVEANTSVLYFVCQSCKEMIGGNPRKLEAFIRMIMPNFMKLKGDEVIASKLLCQILESVNEATPRALQESIIDIVVLVYERLNLESSRETIINSASNLAADLRSLIASSLDVYLYNAKRNYSV